METRTRGAGFPDAGTAIGPAAVSMNPRFWYADGPPPSAGGPAGLTEFQIEAQAGRECLRRVKDSRLTSPPQR